MPGDERYVRERTGTAPAGPVVGRVSGPSPSGPKSPNSDVSVPSAGRSWAVRALYPIRLAADPINTRVTALDALLMPAPSAPGRDGRPGRDQPTRPGPAGQPPGRPAVAPLD